MNLTTRQLKMLHFAVSSIANAHRDDPVTFAIDPEPTAQEMVDLQKLLEARLLPPVLPGMPYGVTMKVQYGEHEYNLFDKIHILVREGQDKAEMAHACACFRYDGADIHYPELPGSEYFGYAENTLYVAGICDPEPLTGDEYVMQDDRTPTSREIRWVRIVSAVNYDPDKVVGPITFMNVFVKIAGKARIKRVYLSAEIPDEARLKIVWSYAAQNEPDYWMPGCTLFVLAVSPAERSQSGIRLQTATFVAHHQQKKTDFLARVRILTEVPKENQ